MTELYFVRHAQSLANVTNDWCGITDVALSKEGYDQVQQLTEQLKHISFDQIYSSPFIRTKETVGQIAALQNKTIILENDLREMNFGVFEGLSDSEVKRLYQNIPIFKQNYLFANIIPNQESFIEVQNRMVKVITKIAQENDGKRVLIGSHYVAIKAFLSFILKLPLENFDQHISLYNTAVNVISYDPVKKEFRAIQLSHE